MIFYRWMRLIVIVVVVAVLATSVFTSAPSATVVNAAAAAQDFSATVEPLGGLVQTLSAGQDQWQTVTQVGLLHKGDKVRTWENGEAQIKTVTGILMKILPNSIVELAKLTLGTGNNSSLDFGINQTIGLSYFSVDQSLKKGDTVQVVSPTGTMTIHGTKFVTIVAPDGSTYVLGQDGSVVVKDGKGNTTVIKSGLASGVVYKTATNGNSSGPSSCQGNSTAGSNCPSSMTDLFKTLTPLTDLSKADANTFRTFLQALLRSLPATTRLAFLTSLLKLPADSTLQQISDAINKIDPAQFKVNFSGFVNSIINQVASNSDTLTQNPLAPATCGNLTCDASSGETALNCPQDCAPTTAICGDLVCSTELGESIESCPKDCNPIQGILDAATIQTGSNAPTGGGGGVAPTGGTGGGGGGGGPATPVPTPKPSGAGV